MLSTSFFQVDVTLLGSLAETARVAAGVGRADGGPSHIYNLCGLCVGTASAHGKIVVLSQGIQVAVGHCLGKRLPHRTGEAGEIPDGISVEILDIGLLLGGSHSHRGLLCSHIGRPAMLSAWAALSTALSPDSGQNIAASTKAMTATAPPTIHLHAFTAYATAPSRGIVVIIVVSGIIGHVAVGGREGSVYAGLLLDTLVRDVVELRRAGHVSSLSVAVTSRPVSKLGATGGLVRRTSTL